MNAAHPVNQIYFRGCVSAAHLFLLFHNSCGGIFNVSYMHGSVPQIPLYILSLRPFQGDCISPPYTMVCLSPSFSICKFKITGWSRIRSDRIIGHSNFQPIGSLLECWIISRILKPFHYDPSSFNFVQHSLEGNASHSSKIGSPFSTKKLDSWELRIDLENF